MEILLIRHGQSMADLEDRQPGLKLNIMMNLWNGIMSRLQVFTQKRLQKGFRRDHLLNP